MKNRSFIRRTFRTGLMIFLVCIGIGMLTAILLVLPYYIVLALSRRISD